MEKKLPIPKFGDVFIGSSTQLDKSAINVIDDGGDKKSTTMMMMMNTERKDSHDIFNFGSPQPSDSSPLHMMNGHDPLSIPQQQQQQQQQSSSSSTTTTTKTQELKKKYEYQKKDLAEPSMATYLDVAVLRCLFTSQWIEDGIDWALNFLYYRLECIEKSRQNQQQFFRTRSYSLPVPKRRYRDSTMFATAAASSVGGGGLTNDSKRNRPNDDQQHHDQELNKDSKLKTFRDVRRSSFSGLPGLFICLFVSFIHEFLN